MIAKVDVHPIDMPTIGPPPLVASTFEALVGRPSMAQRIGGRGIARKSSAVQPRAGRTQGCDSR
jgi:hypothetical protein